MCVLLRADHDTVSDSEVAALFHKRVHARVQVHLFAGDKLCIDSWYALFGEVVRGCRCWCGVPSLAR